MRIRCSHALATLLVSIAPTVHAGSLTLDDAISTALTQNHQLRQASTLLGTYESDLDAVESDFDVQVVPAYVEQKVGSATLKNYGVTVSKKLSTGGNLSLSATRGDTVLPSGVLTIEPSISLTLEQPLFRSAGAAIALHPIQVAKSNLIAAKRKYAEARATLVGDVIDAYANLHEIEQQVKLDALNIDEAAELSRITHEYALVGRAKTLDSMRTDFQLEEAKRRLAADQQRLSAAEASLALLLGMPPESTFTTEAIAWPDYFTLDARKAVGIALDNRLDFAQARQDYDDSLEALGVARDQTNPGLNLTLGYQRYSSSPLPGSGITGGSGPYFGLSSDFGAGYEREEDGVRKAEAQRDAALEGLDIMTNEITLDVEQSLSAYQEARIEYDLAVRAAADAQARLTLARELFHMGRADSFAVTDASAAVISSQSVSLDAGTMVIRAGYKLSLALGTLLLPPDDLRPHS